MEAYNLPGSPGEIPGFYIQATESIQERWPRTLKQGDTFALCDAFGDVTDPGLTPGGLFHRDTRHLSQFQLLLYGHRPLLLSSRVDNDNVVLNVDLSNPDIYKDGRIVVPREVVYLRRSRFLWQGSCRERIILRNFDTRAHSFWISLNFAADFSDLFEIRGLKRARRGTMSSATLGKARTMFRYVGLDNVERRTEISFDPAPHRLTRNQAFYALTLAPGEKTTIDVCILCAGGILGFSRNFAQSYRAARRGLARAADLGGSVSSSNQFANRMLARADADLAMLITDTPQGLYPYAGTPWFSTPFGRDGIITALQMLWLDPELARGVLRYLAANQAISLDRRADAEPGKILHETRASEMAVLGEVPFGRYYGSIDSTPLFVLLAARYYERTGDDKTIRALWPNIEAALSWIDRYGDRDGDGFVEYQRECETGLANQGWKDSTDSVMHADGELACGPIALCEVQAYAFAAKRGGAMLARLLGHDDRAQALEAAAETLRRKFEAQFWCEELGTYALALDGDKRPCKVRSSNAGQVLFCGIASQERAERLADCLMSRAMFSGWGIRTLAADTARFNPMSYHNGSVWPHDNALIALGLAQYGCKRAVSAIFEGLFEAANHMDMMRIPELFCGFRRRPGTAPTLYPVACAPQAWASVVPFALLKAALGLKVEHGRGEIVFHDPQLPAFMEEVEIKDLALGEASIDLRLRRRGGRTEVAMVGRKGDVAIRIMQ